MKKLKIAIYTDYYLPKEHNGGGLEAYIDSIRHELERRGHTVFIVTAGPKIMRDYYKDDKGVIVLPGRRVYRKYLYFGMRMNPYRIDSGLIDMKPDVIHIQSPFSMGLLGLNVGRKLDVKCIATYHISYTSDAAIRSFVSKRKVVIKSVKVFLSRYVRWFHSKVKITIAPSVSVKRELNRLGLKNVIVLQEGIDLSKFKGDVSKAAARRSLDIGRKDKVMLYLGRISADKNLDLFMMAAGELEEEGVKSMIVGGGKDLEYYRGISRKLKIGSIKFTGFVDEDRKILYYKAADVFGFPSNFETYGLVAVEAIASGLPVVAPAGTAQAEIIRPGVNGETFRKDDLEDFVREIKRVLSRKNSYRVKCSVGEFDIKTHVSKLLKIYTS